MALARWQATITDGAGNVIASPNIEVRRDIDGAPIARLYSDRAGATPMANPFVGGTDGTAAFHARGGAYRVRAYKDGFEQEWRYVALGTYQEADQTVWLDPGYLYEFWTATTGDPTGGLFRANHVDLSAATALVIHKDTRGGYDIGARLLELDPGGKIENNTLKIGGVAGGGATFVVDAVSDNGTFVVLSVSGHTGDASLSGDLFALQATIGGGNGAAATIAVGDVQSVGYGQPATVTNVGTSLAAVFDFEIPLSAMGWSPQIVTVADGERGVFMLAGYVGGEGAAPTANVGDYLKADGTFTANIAEAANMRGPAGVSFIWRGPYSGVAAYAENDLAGDQGAAWIALQATTGNAPPTRPTTANAYWELMVDKGADGAGTVASVVAGTGISIDNTDPTAPVVSALLGTNVLTFAAADDATDDGAAFESAQAAAIASGSKLVVVPAGNYLIDTQVDLASGVTWLFLGASLRTSLDTKTILSANTITDWSLLGSLQLVGNKVAPAGETSQHGLYIENCDRFKVEGVIGRALKGRAFFLSGTISSGDRGDRGQFSNCGAFDCSVGRQLDAGAGAEYTTWVNWNASGNDIADVIGAGNTVTTGGSIVDNLVGVELVGGSNHGHGIYSGVQINHNGKNLVAVDVTLGYTFANCHWYDGDIEITNCAGIVLDGGDLDEPTFLVTSGLASGLNYLRNIRCVGGAGQVSPSGTGVAELVVQNCFGPGAPTRNTAFQVEAHVYRNKGSTQSLSSGVTTDLVFPGETSDPLGAFNSGTGVFTVPEDLGGMYEIAWSLIFSGSAMSATSSYVDLVGDNAGDSVFASLALSLPGIFGATKLTFQGTASLRLTAGTKLKFRGTITGTSPVMGNAAWFCFASFKRLGN